MRAAKVLLAVALAAGLAWAYLALSVGNGGEAVEVTIPPGFSAAETGGRLGDMGVLSSPLLFRVAVKATGSERKLKPGTYSLTRGMPVLGALRALVAGARTDVRVAVPEGFSARQIAERLEANGLGKAEDFEAYVRSNRLEGYLFPATYQLEKSWTPEKIAQRMLAEFKRSIEEEYNRASPKPKLSLHQVVTLASIVEREAVLSSEKPMIAAVYLNRLKSRRMLEADPTVQYALGYWKKGLTLADLKHPSPYNTYNHFGLPPGPICNPGLESVRGVLRPAATDAVFFVADTKGGHVFSSTLEEHIKAKKSYKRDLRAIKERLRREGQK